MREARWRRPVLIVALVVAIALITFDFRDGGASRAHSVGADVFGPVEHLAGDAANPFVGFFHAATSDDASEIASLQRQNDQLRAQVSADQVARQDEAQLKSLLHYDATTAYHIVPATVIAAGGEYSDTVTVNEGAGSGIKVNETVLNGDGLVGVVTQVGADTATVDLASDSADTVGIRMAGTSEIGAVTGSGSTMGGTGELKLTLFSAQAVLHPGEEVVTFGSVGGRPYVADVPVGQVASVTSQPGSLTQTALVKPFADFTGLGVVGVVTGSGRG
ncbi:MAG TPA: rod shape-determining protein MreC [Trebonia sp.]|nr:rod shape-determining protein MreC [Trebonia sp.]